MLILEDLAPSIPLGELITAGAPEAETGLRSFAATLGKLHAETVGRSEEYDRLRAGYGPVDRVAERFRFLGPEWHRTPSDVKALGVRLGARAEG